MKIKHYYDFGGLLKNGKIGEKGWDQLRMQNQDLSFSIEKSRNAWVANCENDLNYCTSAEVISRYITDEKIHKVISIGVGKGILEYHIKKILGDEISIECMDYTPNAIEELKKVFLECHQFAVFDVLHDSWDLLDNQALIVLFRMSTEFTEKDWKYIFAKMHGVGIKRILYVPTDILDLTELLKTLKLYVIYKLKGKWKNLTFCGWRYSKEIHLSFWDKYYEVEKHIKKDDKNYYFLKIKEQIC